jgi:hypothetical protein
MRDTPNQLHIKSKEIKEKRLKSSWWMLAKKVKLPETRSAEQTRVLLKVKPGNQPEFQSSIKKRTVNQTVVYFESKDFKQNLTWEYRKLT